MVLTPGATIARVASSTWRTMCPLRRIFSSSAPDLHTTGILLAPCLHRAVGIDHAHDLACDFGDIAVTVHLTQTSLLTVILRQRECLALIFLQTLGDNRFGIILARFELGPVIITGLSRARRLKVDVVDPLAGRTRPAPGKALE